MKELVIIGFDKCGQTALGKHLKCKVDELVYYPDAVERYRTHYSNYTPVFILRDRAEKLWSEYHYYGWNQEISWERFLDYRSSEIDRGYTTPIERTDYWLYINLFREFKPVVLNLEDMRYIMQPMNVNNIICSISAKQRDEVNTRFRFLRKERYIEIHQ